MTKPKLLQKDMAKVILQARKTSQKHTPTSEDQFYKDKKKTCQTLI